MTRLIEQEGLQEVSNSRARLLRTVRETLEDYLNYHDRITRETAQGWPRWHQTIRIRALQKNKRIGVFDDTGFGKTCTFVGGKFLLDKETGQRNPALVIVPNEGMMNAWSAREIDFYAEKFKAQRQKVVTVKNYSDLDYIDKSTDLALVNCLNSP